MYLAAPSHTGVWNAAAREATAMTAGIACFRMTFCHELMMRRPAQRGSRISHHMRSRGVVQRVEPEVRLFLVQFQQLCLGQQPEHGQRADGCRLLCFDSLTEHSISCAMLLYAATAVLAKMTEGCLL